MPEVVRDSYRKAEERGIPNGLHSSFQGDAKSRSAFAPPGRPPGAKLNGMASAGSTPPLTSPMYTACLAWHLVLGRMPAHRQRQSSARACHIFKF